MSKWSKATGILTTTLADGTKIRVKAGSKEEADAQVVKVQAAKDQRKAEKDAQKEADKLAHQNKQLEKKGKKAAPAVIAHLLSLTFAENCSYYAELKDALLGLEE
jgi:uncharacterized membrane protein YdbT with pleckstrin-like domain